MKYSKITGLADDLCLAMQAESVIIDRIPGKSTVGIQIPNPNREPISLRELLESDAYTRSTSKLTLAHGQDHPRRAVRHRPRDDAAPAHRRLDRRRQVGQRQRDDHQHPDARDAGRRPLHHGRPQAARARDVRGHPAPAHAGRDGSEAGGQRAALGGARDGRALQDARRVRRPQHRAVQPQRPRDAGREERASRSSTTRATSSRRSPSSSS